MKTIRRYELRITRQKLEESVVDYERRIRSSKDIAQIVNALIGDAGEEHMLVFHLNAKHTLLGYHLAAKGSVTEITITQPQIFRTALASGAVGIIMAHNHPSGDDSPSDEDVALTRRARRAGAVLNCEVLDHIIIGADGKYTSFLDIGLMAPIPEPS